MKIKISKTELQKALSLIQGIVEKKSTMPILSNVLLETKEKTLSLVATDLEVGINCKLKADVEKEGRVAVHAKSFYDIVKELPDDIISINVGVNCSVEITCKKSSFKIVGLPADEFPSLPKKGKGISIKTESTLISQMIEKVSFAMSTDEMRQTLNGVYIEQDETDKETLRMVAIDGHRLSIVDRKIKGDWCLKKGVIIPRKGIMELRKLIDIENGFIDLWIDDKYIITSSGNTLLVIRLIDGQFPPYKQVIPKQAKRNASIERKVMIQALKRVSVLSVDRSRGVKFIFSPKNLEVSSSTPDFGEAREELPINYKGERFEIGFNAKYFMDVLNVINDDDASFNMGDDTTPCIFKSAKDQGFMHIIMPMRL